MVGEPSAGRRSRADSATIVRLLHVVSAGVVTRPIAAAPSGFGWLPPGSYARLVGYSTALPPEVEAFLRTYGTEQIGRRLPRRWRRRRARTSGDCYARASRWCLGEPVIYTEGRALSGGSIERDWIPHAWLTARDGGVIDLARNEESLEATRYFGVAIPALQVVAISRRHQPRRDGPTVTPLPGPVLPELIRSGWTPT
jgi:hypothetical protein